MTHRLNSSINRSRRVWQRFPRGIALITVLLAVALLMTIIAVLVSVGTTRLRRATEDLHALQALAAADAGAAYFRALLNHNLGDTAATLTDLARAHSEIQVNIDARTSATVVLTVQMPATTAHADHLDSQLQQNPQILEAPAQIAATASVYAAGVLQSTRTVTTLLRIFHHAAPFSEIVGVIDDGGPLSVESPGDPAGQFGGTYATELRLRAYKDSKNGPIPANNFQNERWWDGNSGSTGFLP